MKFPARNMFSSAHQSVLAIDRCIDVVLMAGSRDTTYAQQRDHWRPVSEQKPMSGSTDYEKQRDWVTARQSITHNTKKMCITIRKKQGGQQKDKAVAEISFYTNFTLKKIVGKGK